MVSVIDTTLSPQAFPLNWETEATNRVAPVVFMETLAVLAPFA
jgi:hypothetical protein